MGRHRLQEKTITIRHTVTQATIDGKSKIIQKDRTKTKASYRSLPLVPPFEELLHRLKAEQELNRKLCGKSYCRKFADYIYVNEIGELVKPGYITQHFPLILQRTVCGRSVSMIFVIAAQVCCMQTVSV